jgi:hypothetical protein
MNKKILLHDANHNVSKGLNKYIAKYFQSHNKIEILFNKFHGNLFNIYQKLGIDFLVWHCSEYSQELHDFINEHQNNVKIILIIDQDIPNQDLIYFLQRSNIKFVTKTALNTSYNSLCSFEHLYDHEIFYENTNNYSKNNKILAILSQDNNKNTSLLTDVLYPTTDYPIVAMNNPSFISPVNLGVFNYIELSAILNMYSGILDIDGSYFLETQATNTEYYDIKNYSIKDAIAQKMFVKKINNLEEYTYYYFVNQYIAPYIESNL